MAAAIEEIYEIAFSIWNNIASIAMTLFTTSPTEASGSVYTITYNLYIAISSISTPIACIFFLVAILQEVIASSPDQQLKRLVNDILKFSILAGVLVNLWEFMGYIMQFTDGITEQFIGTGTYEMRITSDLRSAIASVGTTPDVEIRFRTFGEDLSEALKQWFSYIVTGIIFLITSVATLVIIVSSSLSILNCAFQRIIKPLVILPFSSITVAMAAGGNEAKRVTISYLKSFFGFCLSGAIMVVSVKLGTALTDGVIVFNLASMSPLSKVMFISIQTMVAPLAITGLIKGAESTLSRFL